MALKPAMKTASKSISVVTSYIHKCILCSVTRKKSLSSGGVYMTENKAEVFGNFTCN